MSEHSSVPPLRGISHIALTVPDLPAAMAFWTGAMGFEATTETPDLGFVVHREARIGLGLTVHEGGATHAFDERRPGLDHLAFAVAEVAQLEDWHTRLCAHGVPCSPVTDSGSGHHLNLRAPGGIALELYVMNAATAAAFGLAGPEEGVAR